MVWQVDWTQYDDSDVEELEKIRGIAMALETASLATLLARSTHKSGLVPIIGID